MRWFSSDTHFGHANISKFAGRPFISDEWVDGVLTPVADVHHMNVAICDAINERVGPDDELWLLGDVCMGNVDSTLRIRECLVAGRVLLVPGNHDKCHPMGKKADYWVRRYADAGFEVLDPIVELTLTDGTDVQVSHFPYAGDSYDRRRHGRHADGDRFAHWRPVDDGRWLLAGHVHEKWRQQGRVVNVGVDAWGGVPIPEQTIVDVIAAGPADLPAVRWTTKETP